jgi:hypothetical protein
MITEASPSLIASVAGPHLSESPTRAAGWKPMSTVVSPDDAGPPPCAGQEWVSVIRAAAGMKRPSVPGLLGETRLGDVVGGRDRGLLDHRLDRVFRIDR